MSTCDWSTPGADRFTLDASAWVQRAYAADIPASVLVELAARIRRHAYSDQVSITADSVTGAQQYDAVISNMGFGAGRLCATVTRPRLVGSVGALVYTVQGYSIGIAAPCGNPFRLSERPATVAREPEAAPSSGGGSGGAVAPLVFEAPSAGLIVTPIAEPEAQTWAGQVGPSIAFYTGGPILYGAAIGTAMGGSVFVTSPVPEPSSRWLLLLGAVLVVGVFLGHRPR